MAATTRVIWDDDFTAYNFGEGHPMTPLRLELTARLCESFGLFDKADVEVVSPCEASDDLLATIHDRDYIAAVKEAGLDPSSADPRRGLGTDDDPAFVFGVQRGVDLAGHLLVAREKAFQIAS